MSYSLAFFTVGLAAFSPAVSAVFTAVGESPSGNAIYTPSLHETVPVGTAFSITWDATTSGNVSLQLCHGPSTDCVITKTLADNIVNSGSFSWTPTTDLEPSTTTGYGYGIELVAEDGTYQYSTQFGISNDDYSNSSSSSSSSTGSSSATSSVSTKELAPTSTESSFSSSVTSASSAASTTGSGSASTTKTSGSLTTIIGTGSSSSATVHATSTSQTGTSSATSASASASYTGAATDLRASLGSLAVFAGAAMFAL